MKGKKTGGRTKGTPNKTTATIRDWFVTLINDNRQQIEDDFRNLTPKDRLFILEKFLPYIMPKCVNPDEVEGACYTRLNVCSGWNGGEVITWVDDEGQTQFARKQKERADQTKFVRGCSENCEACEYYDKCQYYSDNHISDEETDEDD